MANCSFASFAFAKLDRAILIQASFYRAYLLYADLREADLRGAHLMCADLMRANLNGADLRSAKLANTSLTHTDLRNADLTGCIVYGVSAWDVKLEGTKQQNLVITVPSDVLEGIKLAVPNVRLEGTDPVGRPPKEQVPEISVDNIEVAQFVYLLLHNEKIRDVIDTITSKVVLILGRFTDERKAVLDALREELRKRDYLPILFDFAVPATRDITETVSLLARMARFIIADLTDPSSIPKELEAIVPTLAVPVQPLLEGSSRPYAMFKDYWKYEWVLPVYRYEGLEPLLATLADKVIAPAEGKVKALAERRRMIEAELTKGP
jgi:Pentapeptide repeats (8 copies)